MTQLQARRVERGFTQAEIAKVVGVTERMYRRYESKNKNSVPNVVTALLLAEALDSTPSELFEDILHDVKERIKYERSNKSDDND